MRILGITGTLGAGKGAVVDYLVRECGFRHLSIRALLASIIAERGLPLDRPSMVRVANQLRKEHSSSHLVDRLLEQARAADGPCVIESIRTTAEVGALREAGASLLAVDAPQALRYSRIEARGSETDRVSFEQFAAAEALEWDSAGDPARQSLGECIREADITLVNDGTLEALRAKLREALAELLLGDPRTMADIRRRFTPRPSDVHIVTYPKAGTSWVQEVAWLVNHDGDIECAGRVPSSQRTVYIELSTPAVDKLAVLAASAGPRHIKWHHSAPLLPPRVVEEGRVIYLYRNPRDTAVSWYHFQRMNTLYGFTGTFAQFLDLFLRGDVAYGDYMQSVLSWWALRGRANVLVLSYEELSRNLPAAVRRIASFLGKAPTDGQVAAIAAHCSFERMAANPMTNASSMPKVAGEGEFMRRGQVGDWRRYFTPEQVRRMDEWIAQRAGSEAAPPFEYEA
ncbi:hypothetical protein EMIHUDRAFT_235496 [Emiliania huxleyi CCMP1516]|uniref:Sulfotransferase domain-containing protein n=2 Tax=Emiliania huxleyi TaxID=2903 RepID=A0A0D3JVU3_EMIH1|nr:hypothetical protein EMIHUDRAFT_235496 [Emiliania huxleyi CCMP1516]EOD27628.1 hypothetical protein EMIHUDRAFT_235496 [Emiliania huxleyi CCMP1516]|eukprot:XP_005780057.1 hypothetical protein EMIHUDRAFT_235496 [Emiliania huxleyi CCMP1516]